MKKSLDLKVLMKEAEQRAEKGELSADKEVKSKNLQNFQLMAESDEKNYSERRNQVKENKKAE